MTSYFSIREIAFEMEIPYQINHGNNKGLHKETTNKDHQTTHNKNSTYKGTRNEKYDKENIPYY